MTLPTSALMGMIVFSLAWAAISRAGDAEPRGGRSELPAWSKLDVGERPLLRDAYGRPPDCWPAPVVDPGIEWRELGRLPSVVHPKENPHSSEKVELGRLLFFDKRLSSSGLFACASCHDPDRGWALGRSSRRDGTLGEMPRDPLSLANVGLRTAFGWDGAATGLEQRTRKAIEGKWEMDGSGEVIVERLTASPGYRACFKAAFGDDAVTLQRVVRSLATFQRTLAGGTSWFDQFLEGNRVALSDEAVYGLHIYRTDGHCMNCHHGPDMTDNAFHGVGLAYFGREKYEDLGRYYVTGRPADSGKFKTPSLRDVPRTGPYMHRGAFTLEGVVNMLNAGMPTPKSTNPERPERLFPEKSPLLRPLNLSPSDLNFLVAFLQSLAERPGPYARPKLPDATSPQPETSRSASADGANPTRFPTDVRKEDQ